MKKTIGILWVLILFAGLLGCNKDRSQTSPGCVVSTLLTPDIYWDQAALKGTVRFNREMSVFEKGFLVSRDPVQVIDRRAEYSPCPGDDFLLVLENLQPETVYYAAAYVKTEEEIFYGSIQSFTTTKVCDITVSAASPTELTARSVVLNGVIEEDNGVNAVYVGALYWKDGQPESDGVEISLFIAPSQALEKGDGFHIPLSGLEPGVDFHGRMWAKNSKDKKYSDVFDFSTLEVVLPEVASGTVARVGSTGAALEQNRLVSDGNDPQTVYGVYFFESDQDADIPSRDWIRIEAADIQDGSFTVSVNKLLPNTSYKACAFARNPAGVVLGEKRDFTTLDMSAPAMLTVQYRYDDYLLPVEGTAEVNFGRDYVYMRASDVSLGGSDALQSYGFDWGWSEEEVLSGANRVTASDFDGQKQTFSYKLSGLDRPGQKIYYRAWAVNEKGEGVSDQVASLVVPSLKAQWRKDAVDLNKTVAVSPARMLEYYELDPIEVEGGEKYIFLDRNLGAIKPCTDVYAQLFKKYGQTDYWSGLFDAVGDYYRYGANVPILTIDVRADQRNDLTVQVDGLDENDGWTSTPCPQGYRIPGKEHWQKMIDKFGNKEVDAFKKALRISGTSFVRTGNASYSLPNNYNQYSTFLAASTRSQKNTDAGTNQMDYLIVEYIQIPKQQAAQFDVIEVSEGKDGGFNNANHIGTGMPVRCFRIEQP